MEDNQMPKLTPVTMDDQALLPKDTLPVDEGQQQAALNATYEAAGAAILKDVAHDQKPEDTRTIGTDIEGAVTIVHRRRSSNLHGPAKVLSYAIYTIGLIIVAVSVIKHYVR